MTACPEEDTIQVYRVCRVYRTCRACRGHIRCAGHIGYAGHIGCARHIGCTGHTVHAVVISGVPGILCMPAMLGILGMPDMVHK